MQAPPRESSDVIAAFGLSLARCPGRPSIAPGVDVMWYWAWPRTLSCLSARGPKRAGCDRRRDLLATELRQFASCLRPLQLIGDDVAGAQSTPPVMRAWHLPAVPCFVEHGNTADDGTSPGTPDQVYDCVCVEPDLRSWRFQPHWQIFQTWGFASQVSGEGGVGFTIAFS